MIKKIMLILLCSIILFPAIVLADNKPKLLEVGEEVKIYNGSWVFLESIGDGTDLYIGYKGIFRNSIGSYVQFAEYYNNREFLPIIYDSHVQVMCVGEFAFEPIEIQPQFISLEFLGDCYKLYPQSKNNELKTKKEEKINRSVLIRK